MSGIIEWCGSSQSLVKGCFVRVHPGHLKCTCQILVDSVCVKLSTAVREGKAHLVLLFTLLFTGMINLESAIGYQMFFARSNRTEMYLCMK